MYNLSSVLDFEELRDVRPGSSILLSGPAMSGKQRLAYDILMDGARDGEGAVVVSTNDSAPAIAEEFQTGVPDLADSQLGIVDCRGEGGTEADAPDGTFVHKVSSPGDLTGIGIGITKALEGLHTSGRTSGRLALVSLSTMLTYTDKKTVFKFCHVLSSRLDTADYVGVFTIDSGAHDTQTLQVIKQAFDGLIEVREAEAGGREARVLGLASEPTAWKQL
ncbi:RAD55 family ATPase [Halomicroarcula sp. GCM10025324]|jgi:KaiC/GvpD/RAD55 family RecA-like ATPase|uniref:RAD55 family ATPase n=1 Tax=Haloarcula TaxID=2237 RepID=UPI0023E8B6E9|nr:ATPase domain-containing protein [Halomicroarcula sp. ZS-22-S1]